MGQPGSALATLREPSPDEASQWHKPRAGTAAARMHLLADFLAEDEAVRVVKRTDAGAELLFTAAGGVTLRVNLRPDVIDVRVGPFVVQSGTEPPPRDRYLDEASCLVEVLQLGTGFYVSSDELLGFDPVGACPGCGLEVYEWQDECGICDAKLHPLAAGEDEHDARARRVVDVLLRREMIELVTPRGRRNVEQTVSAFYAHGAAAPEVLLSLLIEMPDVAEVYCDASALRQALVRIA